MKISEQIISKGSYELPGVNNFISLSQYIFFRSMKKKYLLLRFSNEADFVVNGIEFELTQFDAYGKMIERKTVRSSTLSEKPGAVFALPDGFCVDEGCVDFKVSILAVYSGDYVYLVREGEISIEYKPTAEKAYCSPVDTIEPGAKELFVVRSKNRTSYPFAFAVAMIAAVAICAISTFAYYCLYIPW